MKSPRLWMQVDAGIAEDLVFGDPKAPRFVFWNKKLRPTPSGPGRPDLRSAVHLGQDPGRSGRGGHQEAFARSTFHPSNMLLSHGRTVPPASFTAVFFCNSYTWHLLAEPVCGCPYLGEPHGTCHRTLIHKGYSSQGQVKSST